MGNFTEEEIEELTEKVYLIKDKLEEGTFRGEPGLIEKLVKSLHKIKINGEGKVDPTTVDERIKYLDFTLESMKYRESLKSKFGLIYIQNIYFDFLFRYFGGIYHKMVESGVTPDIAAEHFASFDELVEGLYKDFPALSQEIIEFWKKSGEVGSFHLQDSKVLKATFSGEIFPSHVENAVSIAGIYIDTIVLPCPIARIAPLSRFMDKHVFFKTLIKHVLTCMTYKDVVLEDIEPPIAVVLPDYIDISSEDKTKLKIIAEPHIITHANLMFDNDFSDLGEVKKYCFKLNTLDKLLMALKCPDRMIFSSEWGLNPGTQITKAMESKGRPDYRDFEKNPGFHVYMNIASRMTQALAAKEYSRNIQGVPCINSETSWSYYNWLLEYESNKYYRNSKPSTDMHMVHALNFGNNQKISWLGNVPVKTVLKIRREGMMEEVRGILSSGVRELINQNGTDYNTTTNKVMDNIDAAFKRHVNEIKRLQRDRLKTLGFDIGLLSVTGIIGITSAYTGNGSLGAISAALGMAGFPNLKDIKTKISAFRTRENNHKKSPAGVLFSHIKK